MRSHLEAAVKFPYPLIKIGLDADRDVLRDRIRTRTQAMIAGGLLDEVRGLISQGLSDWAPLSSVGYREAAAFLKAKGSSLSELEEEIVTSTAQLTKKQRTWFKRDEDIRWFSSENESLLAQISEHLGL
jgi:tRNA dimethylallyltransferase